MFSLKLEFHQSPEQLRPPAQKAGNSVSDIPNGPRSKLHTSQTQIMPMFTSFCQKVWSVSTSHRAILIPASVLTSAWNVPFAGKCNDLLWLNIQKMDKERSQNNEDNHYVNYVSIIQSSGSGKSRMVDEVAKRVFTLPFNLRSEDMNPCVYQNSTPHEPLGHRS